MDQLKLQEYDEQRQSIYDATKGKFKAGLIMIGIGAVVLLIGIIFGGDQKNAFIVLPGFAVLFIGALILASVSTKRQRFLNEFKAKFFDQLIKDLYDNYTYDAKNGLPLSDIMEPGFFKSPDRYDTYDRLASTFEGVPFEMSGFDLRERHESTDSQGHTTVDYVTYAKGKMIIIDFKRDIMDTVKVLETKFLGADTSGLHKIETESIEFNKKFKTYTSNDLTTFYLLTPQIQLKLLELEQKFRGSIFFAFYKGKFYVAINDNNDTLTIDLKKSLMGEQMDLLISELSIPAAVIKELKLSGDKFNSDMKY